MNHNAIRMKIRWIRGKAIESDWPSAHSIVTEFKIENIKVFFQTVLLAGLWNRQDASLKMKTKQDLNWSLFIFLRCQLDIYLFWWSFFKISCRFVPIHFAPGPLTSWSKMPRSCASLSMVVTRNRIRCALPRMGWNNSGQRNMNLSSLTQVVATNKRAVCSKRWKKSTRYVDRMKPYLWWILL